jgi:hypothetical protein
MEPITSPLPFANPFGRLVGQPLDNDQVDIAGINAESFLACQRLVDDVAAGGFSAALTVFGDAGTGKTHLIGRVRRWLEEQPKHLFVFVRMETSPTGIWRHLRRSLALALLRTDEKGVRTLDALLGQRKNDLEELADRDLSIVLGHLLNRAHVRDSAAWLRGDGMPEEVLRSLRLSTPGLDEEAEVSSRRLVMEICELIRPGVVVFCMDQIEAIMSSPGDREGPHAFGRVVSCLVDESRNSAIICCQQSVFVNLMEQILDGATRARVFGRRAVIHPLSWQQAQQLITARLAGVPAEGFLQLVNAGLKDVFVDNAAPARKIIARCKDLFDHWQSGGRSGHIAAVEPLEDRLQQMLDERFSRKTPSETEAILRNGIPLLARSAGAKCSAAGSRSPLDFSINDGQISVGICNEANANSLGTHLKKISETWKPAADRKLLLLRDARLPVSRTAKVTNQRIAQIQSQGGRWVTVSQEAAEALAALRRLLSDAESGDLAHHGDSVSPASVEQWIAGHLPQALDPLVSELGSAAASTNELAAKLAALLAEKKMMKLEEAAASLEATPGEVETCARSDPRQFGILGGRVPALFQPVASAPAR